MNVDYTILISNKTLNKLSAGFGLELIYLTNYLEEWPFSGDYSENYLILELNANYNKFYFEGINKEFIKFEIGIKYSFIY